MTGLIVRIKEEIKCLRCCVFCFFFLGTEASVNSRKVNEERQLSVLVSQKVGKKKSTSLLSSSQSTLLLAPKKIIKEIEIETTEIHGKTLLNPWKTLKRYLWLLYIEIYVQPQLTGRLGSYMTENKFCQSLFVTLSNLKEGRGQPQQSL